MPSATCFRKEETVLNKFENLITCLTEVHVGVQELGDHRLTGAPRWRKESLSVLRLFNLNLARLSTGASSMATSWSTKTLLKLLAPRIQ